MKSGVALIDHGTRTGQLSMSATAIQRQLPVSQT